MAKRTQISATTSPETPSLDPHLRRRVVVEAITPQVDGGQVPIKRTPAEDVTVEADI
ncbi:MAG: maltotransferase domain-containing protein, partial [Actinomycetes bacterium]